MTVTADDAGFVWLAVAVIGLGTYAIRFSFLLLFEWVDTVPARLETALQFVPAAVLAALVLPAVVVLDGSPALVGNDRLLAAGLASVVAWRTEDILATIVVGMVALVALQAAF